MWALVAMPLVSFQSGPALEWLHATDSPSTQGALHSPETRYLNLGKIHVEQHPTREYLHHHQQCWSYSIQPNNISYLPH